MHDTITMHAPTPVPRPHRRPRRHTAAVSVTLAVLVAVGIAAFAVTTSADSAELGSADGVIAEGRPASVFDNVPAITNLKPDLLAALRDAATDAQAVGVAFGVNSGWRSPAYQEQLWRAAVDEHGSEAEAARWVAPPDTSRHLSGAAVDLSSPGADWLGRHGARYSLCRVYGNEPWHFELRSEAVADGCPPGYADAAHDPRLR